MSRENIVANIAVIGAVIAFILTITILMSKWEENEEQVQQIVSVKSEEEYAPQMPNYYEVVSTEDWIAEEIAADELELIALCVEAEAGNQNILGKELVAAVILNRVDDKDFPNTITEVITQPKQFTSYWNGAMDRVSPADSTFRAVEMELQNRIHKNVFYFNTGDYSRYGKPWEKIGDHYFSEK